MSQVYVVKQLTHMCAKKLYIYFVISDLHDKYLFGDI